jgi:Flp pilus assembly pilin Flp
MRIAIRASVLVATLRLKPPTHRRGGTGEASLRDEHGQDLIEYALLVGLVALVAVSAVTEVGNTIKDVFWAVIAASIP